MKCQTQKVPVLAAAR